MQGECGGRAGGDRMRVPIEYRHRHRPGDGKLHRCGACRRTKAGITRVAGGDGVASDRKGQRGLPFGKAFYIQVHGRGRKRTADSRVGEIHGTRGDSVGRPCGNILPAGLRIHDDVSAIGVGAPIDKRKKGLAAIIPVAPRK